MDKFDADEKDILESYERDEWVSVENLEEQKEAYADMLKIRFQKIKGLIFEFLRKILLISRQNHWKKAFPIKR